jgi:hypothetical protein
MSKRDLPFKVQDTENSLVCLLFFEKQWYVPNVGTIVESDNVFHRDMAKLREFGLHIIFKWLQNQVQYKNLEPRLKNKRYQNQTFHKDETFVLRQAKILGLKPRPLKSLTLC